MVFHRLHFLLSRVICGGVAISLLVFLVALAGSSGTALGADLAAERTTQCIANGDYVEESPTGFEVANSDVRPAEEPFERSPSDRGILRESDTGTLPTTPIVDSSPSLSRLESTADGVSVSDSHAAPGRGITPLAEAALRVEATPGSSDRRRAWQSLSSFVADSVTKLRQLTGISNGAALGTGTMRGTETAPEASTIPSMSDGRAPLHGAVGRARLTEGHSWSFIAASVAKLAQFTGTVDSVSASGSGCGGALDTGTTPRTETTPGAGTTPVTSNGEGPSPGFRLTERTLEEPPLPVTAGEPSKASSPSFANPRVEPPPHPEMAFSTPDALPEIERQLDSSRIDGHGLEPQSSPPSPPGSQKEAPRLPEGHLTEGGAQAGRRRPPRDGVTRSPLTLADLPRTVERLGRERCLQHLQHQPSPLADLSRRRRGRESDQSCSVGGGLLFEAGSGAGAQDGDWVLGFDEATAANHNERAVGNSVNKHIELVKAAQVSDSGTVPGAGTTSGSEGAPGTGTTLGMLDRKGPSRGQSNSLARRPPVDMAEKRRLGRDHQSRSSLISSRDSSSEMVESSSEMVSEDESSSEMVSEDESSSEMVPPKDEKRDCDHPR